jgi:hypothetical protein
MQDYWDETVSHAFSNHQYARIFGRDAWLEIKPWGGGSKYVISIDFLVTLGPRGGLKGLRFITDLADKYGLPMKLYAKPLGHGATLHSTQDLIKLYKRFGFRVEHMEWSFMRMEKAIEKMEENGKRSLTDTFGPHTVIEDDYDGEMIKYMEAADMKRRAGPSTLRVAARAVRSRSR